MKQEFEMLKKDLRIRDVVNFRVTTPEKANLKERAEEEGLSLSRFIREKLSI